MKTIVVTGFSGNLGHSVAAKFLEEGYTVCGADKVKTDQPGIDTSMVDLVDEKAAEAWIKSVINNYHVIGVAVLTAGGFAMADIAGTSASAIAEQYKLNFETAYNVARPVFVQMMKQGSGRIFLIGSRAGLHTGNSKGMIAYGLSKSLLFRLAELMNAEAAGTDVKIVVVVPSTIDTPQNRTAIPDADFSKWQTPDSIAATIFANIKRNAETGMIIEL